uniref:Uncharacterized protein n=1 Tax=Nothobranchius kuhntae TaxID=321403 RepID=A0A1A8JJU3_NOTKU
MGIKVTRKISPRTPNVKMIMKVRRNTALTGTKVKVTKVILMVETEVLQEAAKATRNVEEVGVAAMMTTILENMSTNTDVDVDVDVATDMDTEEVGIIREAETGGLCINQRLLKLTNISFERALLHNNPDLTAAAE